MNVHPPKLARKIFEWIAGEARVDDLLGDMDELFYLNLKTMSPVRGKIKYWKHILSLSFSYALRKRKRDSKYGIHSSSALSLDMIRNYVKVAWRNLCHYKYFSVINAFGLAIGMSVSLLLISLFSFVSTYDNFHEHRDRIVTINSSQHEGVQETDYATAPLLLADRIRNEFASGEEVVKIVKGEIEIKTSKENIPVNCYYTENNFFRVFSFEMLHGNMRSLDRPNQLILTQSAAEKLFNTGDVLGKTIELSTGEMFEVAGVMKDPPKNSHLTFEILLPLSSLPRQKGAEAVAWIEYPSQYTYVLLKSATASTDLQAFVNNVADDQYKQSPVRVTFQVQHLLDIVRGPDLRNAIGVKWEATGFLMFGVFALMILLPACFNYTNISIARALRRAKEIGLRKTMGGVKSQIFFQFITETIVITLISFVGALLIFVVIRSEFQSMLVAGSSLDLSLTPRMFLMFLIFALLTGFFAGIFPAMHFSGLNPIKALKSKVNTVRSTLTLLKVFTVFQFALSFGFILSLIVFSRQYRYSLNFDFGFEKKNIVDVQLQDVSPDRFRSHFSGLASVKSISMSSGLLGVNTSPTWVKNGNDSTEVSQLFVDENFVHNFKLTLIAGKDFPKEEWQRERYLVVNEEFLRTYKIKSPHDALGHTFNVDGMDLEVIGVVKDFHFAPLRLPIGKFFFRNNPSEFRYANMQVVTSDALTLFAQFEETWKSLATEKKFIANFFEEGLNEAYESYRVLLKIVGFLGLLAITISLLGMLGMVVYTAETKTKEVGIRKVMGATAANIALLLSKDYLKMMGWAIAVAIPITAFLLNKLLPQIQYYSVQLNVWDVVLSTTMLLGLGLLIIASQTYRTAMTNPALTLRSE